MSKSIFKIIVALPMAVLLSFSLSGNAQAAGACGGENQKSCWSANPAKWCEGNLKYVPGGVPGKGKCIKRPVKPSCGGVNEKSCWSANPAKWCDGNLKYIPGGIPGKGRCVERISNSDLKSVAKNTFNKIDSLGKNNPLQKLRSCLLKPGNFADLKEQMGKRSENGINSILGRCNVSPSGLRAYGQEATGTESSTLFIELGGGAVVGAGAEGAAVGADISVGLTSETMPTAHWATDKGKSVNFSGKFMGAVSVSIDFPRHSAAPSGFTVSGGVGLGAEIGVVILNWDKYLYNF